jgi:hypothetical protein
LDPAVEPLFPPVRRRGCAARNEETNQPVKHERYTSDVRVCPAASSPHFPLAALAAPDLSKRHLRPSLLLDVGEPEGSLYARAG